MFSALLPNQKCNCVKIEYNYTESYLNVKISGNNQVKVPHIPPFSAFLLHQIRHPDTNLVITVVALFPVLPNYMTSHNNTL